MPRSLHSLRALTTVVMVMVMAALLVMTSPQAAATATAEMPSFSIAPLNVEKAFVEMTVEAGSTYTINIGLFNAGNVEGNAYTYAANVNSNVGGGMVIDLAGSEPTGTTRWLDYNDETVTIAAQASVTRPLTITVPDDAAPGEYRSALVIQPAATDVERPAGDAGVYMTTTTRQAIPVSLTVAGELVPAFSIASASAHGEGAQPYLDITISNDGNVRIMPEGSITLHDATGDTLLQQPVSMKAVYAWDATQLRVPLSTALPLGTYSLAVQLTDTRSGVSASADLPVEVTDTPDVASASTDAAPFIDRLGDLTANPASGGSLWPLLALLAAGLGVGGVIVMRKRAHRPTTEPSAN